VTTQQALQKYQGDNRMAKQSGPRLACLNQDGLGPDNDHLLNPESAMTSTAPATHATPDPSADPKK